MLLLSLLNFQPFFLILSTFFQLHVYANFLTIINKL